MGVVSVSVYAGDTASTLRFTVALCVVEGPVPVTVTVYSVGGVRVVVVIVSVGLAGGVTELRMEHVAPLVSTGTTAHDSATEPVKPPRVPSVIVEIEDPPGSTAEG